MFDIIEYTQITTVRCYQIVKRKQTLKCNLYKNNNNLSAIYLFFYFRFNGKKGFYCKIKENGGTSCLGGSKGRKYPPIDERSYKLLQVTKYSSLYIELIINLITLHYLIDSLPTICRCFISHIILRFQNF